MTDRELLEAAAKAAGIEVLRSRLNDPLCGDMLVTKSSRNLYHENGPWNPLTDDGDALRLAVKLNLSTDVFVDVIIVVYTTNDIQCDHVEEPVGTDPYAATRRAIVRAAAEIGRPESEP
jgi:hypothetical protein